MQKMSAAAEQRAERRSNLFVIAALYGEGASAPITVRIRNLSPGGALVEGPELPDVGTNVRLCRGQLSAAGELLWRGPSHAGLRFTGPVHVADWLPGSARNSGQQRVDQIVFEARAAPPLAPSPAALAPTRPDYAAIARSLTQAGEALLADPDVAQRHLGALQAIDIAAQALDGLADDQ